MKKYLLLMPILCFCLTALGATGRGHQEPYSYTTTIYQVTLSGAQTQTELVAAISGISFVIDKIIFSSASAGTLYLSDTTGADVDYGYLSIPANGCIIDNDVNVKFAAGEAIDVTTSADAYVMICYHNE